MSHFTVFVALYESRSLDCHGPPFVLIAFAFAWLAPSSVYETPFATTHHTYRFIVYIIAGIRLSRPQGSQGSWFTDAAWDILELSRRKGPGKRPHLHAALRCLQDATRPTKSISGVDGDVPADTEHGPNHTVNEYGMFSIPSSMPVVDCRCRRANDHEIPPRSHKAIRNSSHRHTVLLV